MIKKAAILEGIRKGERALKKGAVFRNARARKQLARWLKHNTFPRTSKGGLQAAEAWSPAFRRQTVLCPRTVRIFEDHSLFACSAA